MAEPLGREEIAALIAAGLPEGLQRAAVAVSGGADSLALAWAVAQLAPGRPALHVNHRLRAAADAEAEQVSAWALALGLTPHILVWDGGAARGDLQARARRARYRLMEDWCRARGVEALLLAHHLDDQAETVLLRLARGSGPDGLAAMRPRSGPLTPGADTPVRVRPFLTVPKARLKASLQAAGLSWLEDPSNRLAQFDRVRARQMLADPPLAGLKPLRLAATAARMAMATEVLQAAERALRAEAVTAGPLHTLRLALGPWRSALAETRLRLLASLVRTAAGAAYRPRFERLRRLAAGLMDKDFSGACLFGCQILPDGPDAVLFLREAAAIGPDLQLGPGESGLWDGRYRIAATEGPVRVAALGPDGWVQVKERVPAAPGPHAARLVLPAVWRAGQPVAVAALGLETPGVTFTLEGDRPV